MQAAEKPVPTSLKLPAAVKREIDEAARAAGTSSHAYMIDVLQKAVERQRLRDQFQRDAMEALREAEATGLGHDLADVEAYFAQMAEFRAGRASRPAPLEPQPLAR